MPPPPSISHPHWLLASVPVQKLGEAICSPKLSEIKRDGPDLVLASDSLVIKVRVPVGIIDRLRTRFGRGRLARQAAGAATLESLRVLTAQVLGHGTGQLGGSACELLVMQRVPGVSLLAIMQDPCTPIEKEHAVADALGRQIAQMTMAGWFNRDHKPSNLIMQLSDDDALILATIAIIDTVDILPIKPRHKFLAAAVRMLASLVLEPTGCNCPPRRTLSRRVLLAMHQEFWTLQGASAATTDEPSIAADADTLDPEWESQSSRAVWKMTRERIAAHLQKHGTATPKVSPR